MSKSLFENGSYSFQDVNAAITGPGIDLAITGEAEEGVDIEFEGDKNTLTMGADGSGMHSLHAAQNGRITIRILKTSPINRALNQVYLAQTASAANNGKNVIVVSDLVRGDTLRATGCSFQQHPNVRYAKDGNIHEWRFLCTRITPDLGPGVDTLIS